MNAWRLGIRFMVARMHAALVAAAWGALCVAGPVWGQAAAQPAVSEVQRAAFEDGLWMATSMARTESAYLRYLELFPKGRFSDQARLEIARLKAAPPAAEVSGQRLPDSLAGSGLAVDPGKLLSGASTSAAVTQMPGEVYIGPGPMTVGYLGAKKQLVLPNGAWVLLSSVDRLSGHATPVPMTSMVFGQFRQGRLVSLLSYLFTGKVIGPQGWGDLNGCLSGKEVAPQAARATVEAGSAARACAWTVTMRQLPQVADAGWEQALGHSQQLGVSPAQPPVQFTRAWTVDGGGTNYLMMRRADFLSASGQDELVSAQAARLQWLQAYLPVMQEGFVKKLPVDELEPGKRPSSAVRIQLPD